MFRPDEIIVVRDVADEPVTRRILARCSGVPVRLVHTNRQDEIKGASTVLSLAEAFADRIAAGKRVLALVSTVGEVGAFNLPDPRMGCPEFVKLVLVSNGCPYACQWGFLQGTYRALCPFMAVHVRFDAVQRRILSFLRRPANSSKSILFNNGELQDSLALEHLTGAAETFIPFFGQVPNGYLFLLTKSDNVDPLLQLPHNGHTILAWSLNAPKISREFELGAPPVGARLRAAERAQRAGYRLRIRLDPIVPLLGWQEMYAAAIREIFKRITPERVTMGTLRFEERLHKNRQAVIGRLHPGSRLLGEMEKMEPMLPPLRVPAAGRDRQGRPRTKMSVGKYSYHQDLRLEIFRFVISEVRRHYDGPLALCKETLDVWRAVGLDPGRCACVCQYESADIVGHATGPEDNGT